MSFHNRRTCIIEYFDYLIFFTILTFFLFSGSLIPKQGLDMNNIQFTLSSLEIYLIDTAAVEIQWEQPCDNILSLLDLRFPPIG